MGIQIRSGHQRAAEAFSECEGLKNALGTPGDAGVWRDGHLSPLRPVEAAMLQRGFSIPVPLSRHQPLRSLEYSIGTARLEPLEWTHEDNRGAPLLDETG